MKISNLFLALFLLQLSFVGCSSDDNGDSESEETFQLDPIIIGYKSTYLGEPIDPNAHTSKTIYTTAIEDNKKQVVTSEHFYNNESQGVYTAQEFTFNTFGKVSKFTIEHVDYQLVREYFYDAQQRLVGANMGEGSPQRFFRFQHIASNMVYFEETSLPFNDPNTEVRRRYIMEFDEKDNIVKAGKDFDFDGNMDGINTFQYDSNNNLISGQMASGETFSIAYSLIINTEQYLENKTFGKKMNRILCGELFGGNYINWFKDGEHSFNVTLEESQQSTFEVLDNNFYNKKTEIVDSNPNINQTYTHEFTFQ